MSIFMYIFMCIFMYVCMYVCIYVCMYVEFIHKPYSQLKEPFHSNRIVNIKDSF